MTVRWSSWAATDTGTVRSGNEDAFVDRPAAGIWAVADGAGGQEHGEVASAELKATLGEVRSRSGILRFLVARMVYQDGVNALLTLGGAFAALIFGWSITEIGIYGIILNVIAIFGCWLAARLDTALGSKTVVVMSLCCLTVATIGIVSTGPGYTLFGMLPLAGADTGGLAGRRGQPEHPAGPVAKPARGVQFLRQARRVGGRDMHPPDIAGDIGDTAIVGISPDQPEKLARFDEKYGLGFTLLSDPDHQVAEAYGVWGEKKNYGRTYMGIIRSAFLIDEQGKVSHAWPKISPKDTPTKLLKALAEG